MPYTSKAQSRFMHAQHPQIAERFDAEQPDQKGLPERARAQAMKNVGRRAKIKAKK